MAGIYSRLAYLQQAPGFGPVVSIYLRARGTFIPPATLAGDRIWLVHTGHGVVIDERTRIGNDVRIFQNVTVGRQRPWLEREEETGSVVIEDGAMLCAGAVILLPSDGTLVVGRRSVIGANAVLSTSCGPGEIWAGNPAVKVGHR